MSILHLLKKILCGGLLVFVLATTYSQQNKNFPAPVKVASVEGITEYKFGNGLRVLLFPDPSKPTITVNNTLLVGSALEGYGETGMAHLLEHMLFKGSTKHLVIPKEEKEHGAKFNADTWYDRTHYYETFAATEENLAWALDLESDRMINSFIADKDLQSEFSVVRNEFEGDENNSAGILEERVFSTAYLWHNYGKSTIGSKEDIERVPAERLKIFYKKYYQPDNAVLMITGKIDEAKTLRLVQQYFGNIPKPARVLSQAYTVEPVQDGERSVTLRRTGDLQVAACGYHIVAAAHPDFAAISILNTILSDKPSGRLYKALVETKKATDVSGEIFALKDPGYIYFSANILKEKNQEDVKNTMLAVLDSLLIQPITSAEVERAKNLLLTKFDLDFRNSETVSTIMTEYIADGDWRLSFIYRDNLKKATADDVNRVAKAYFKSSNRTVGLFIPEKNPDRAFIPLTPDVNALVKEYKGMEKLNNAEAFDASPANIDKRTKTGTIAGGAKYAVLSKTTLGDAVTAVITLRMGDEQSLFDKTIISQLTAQMLRRGTTDKTYQQLNDALDKLQSTVFINVGNGNNAGRQTSSITITSTKGNLDKVLALVDEMLRHPSFSQKELEALQQEKLAKIDQDKTDPQPIAINTCFRMVMPYPKGHINYMMDFDEETAATKKATVEDIRKFYSDFYNSAHASISIVGDCNENATILQLTSMLQNWNSKQAFAHVENKYSEVDANDLKINTSDKKNAWLYAGQPLQLSDEAADYPALFIGNSILGGGGLYSRLATRIRQKEGISYSVGSFVFANSLDRSGFFISYAMYNPNNLDRLVKAYKEEIAGILKEGVTAEELKEAKSGYLQSAQVDRSDDSRLVTLLNSHLFLKRTMAWNANLEKQIAELTVDQVNKALVKYIHPEKFIYVKAGDFDKEKK
jgi:zinc protease